jgi:hypothetical protein
LWPGYGRRERYQCHPIEIRSQQVQDLHPHRRQQKNIRQPKGKLEGE